MLRLSFIGPGSLIRDLSGIESLSQDKGVGERLVQSFQWMLARPLVGLSGMRTKGKSGVGKRMSRRESWGEAELGEGGEKGFQSDMEWLLVRHILVLRRR
jgi:hypothetical protein